MNTWHVVNTGQVVIENLEINLDLSARHGNIDFWEIEHSDPLSKTTVEKSEISFKLKRDFLNPKRAYKEDIIKINIFSNTQLNFAVVGGGKSWYAQYEDRSMPDEKILKMLRQVFWLTFALAIFSSLVSWLSFLITEQEDPYWRLLIEQAFQAPFLLLAAGGTLLAYFRVVAYGKVD